MGTTANFEEGAALRPVFTVPAGVLSDEALASRVRAGDERAFEQLYARYRDPLFRYCASVLRQPEDAEEALQSAMLGAYRSLVSGDRRELAVRAWLYRIAHNQCIDLLRRRPLRPTELLTGQETLPSQSVADRVETADELGRLQQDLLSLPDDQRGALVMRELSGLSHEQIGEALDESAAGVKQLIYQARLGLYAMAEGRALECETVRRRLSDGDGRVLRSRGIGAHLRACAGCRGFRESIAARPAQLSALVPVLPLVAGERILSALRDLGVGGLGGGGGGAAVGGAGAGAAGGGGLASLGGGLAAKLAAVAVLAGVGGSAVVVVPAVMRGPAATNTRAHVPASSPDAGSPFGSVPLVLGLGAAATSPATSVPVSSSGTDPTAAPAQASATAGADPGADRSGSDPAARVTLLPFDPGSRSPVAGSGSRPGGTPAVSRAARAVRAPSGASGVTSVTRGSGAPSGVGGPSGHASTPALPEPAHGSAPAPGAVPPPSGQASQGSGTPDPGAQAPAVPDPAAQAPPSPPTVAPQAAEPGSVVTPVPASQRYP